jgi:hypothetical protein
VLPTVTQNTTSYSFQVQTGPLIYVHRPSYDRQSPRHTDLSPLDLYHLLPPVFPSQTSQSHHSSAVWSSPLPLQAQWIPSFTLFQSCSLSGSPQSQLHLTCFQSLSPHKANRSLLCSSLSALVKKLPSHVGTVLSVDMTELSIRISGRSCTGCTLLASRNCSPSLSHLEILQICLESIYHVTWWTAYDIRYRKTHGFMSHLYIKATPASSKSLTSISTHYY